MRILVVKDWYTDLPAKHNYGLCEPNTQRALKGSEDWNAHFGAGIITWSKQSTHSEFPFCAALPCAEAQGPLQLQKKAWHPSGWRNWKNQEKEPRVTTKLQESDREL